MTDLHLFHGDNYPQSRERLNALIEKFRNQGIKELVRLDGRKVSLGEIKQAMEAKSLFGGPPRLGEVGPPRLGEAGERLVVVENLLSAPASKRQKEIIAYFLGERHDFPIILWEKKEIKSAVLNKFKSKFKVEIFKIPAVIFKLLDGIRPGNHQQVIGLLHQMDKKEPEMVFYMLCQRIRQLILAKDLGKNGLEGLQGWQQARLLNQAAQFELSQLRAFYHQLLEIDYQQKTSQTPFNLFSTLDLLLANL